jgi:hypothetical protein
MKRLLRTSIPEILLIASTIYYWSLTSIFENWLAPILLVILIFLVISQNRIVGLVIGSLISIASFYLVLALISELNEFPDFNDEAKKMLLFGSLLIGFNIIISTWLLFKYATKEKSLPSELNESSNVKGEA